MALRVSCRVDCGIDTRGFSALSRRVAEASGRSLPTSKPVTGEAAFLHESGIHCAGLLRDRATYEAFSSDEVGCAAPEFLLGRHSGSSSLTQACLRLGVYLNASQQQVLLEKIRQEACSGKGAINETRLRALIREVQQNPL